MLSKETLAGIAADLRAGRAVELSPADFPCFSAEALKDMEAQGGIHRYGKNVGTNGDVKK